MRKMREIAKLLVVSSNIAKIETLVALSLFLFLWVAIGWLLYYYQIQYTYGDATLAAQVLHNFRHTWLISSSYTESQVQALTTIWYKPGLYACLQPLVSDMSDQPIIYHFFFIAYLFAPIAKFVDSYILIAALHSFCYISILVFSYFFARAKRLSIITAVLLTLLVAQHPLWNMGLFGQFSFNRLFLPTSATVIWFLDGKKHTILLTIAIILAMLTNEIFGIALAMLFITYVVFIDRTRKRLLFVGIACFTVSYIMLKYIQVNFKLMETGVTYFRSLSQLNIQGLILHFIQQLFTIKTFFYIAVNMLFLGILTILRPRTFFVLLLFLVPNIFISVGGAEKTGWATHYHLAYFVPLIWLAISALATGYIKAEKARIIIVLALLVITTLINPVTLTLYQKPYIAVKDLVNKINFYRIDGKNDLALRANMRKAVSPSDSISAPEPAVYYYYDHPVFYYPMNIDSVTKVVFAYDPTKPGLDRFFSPNYGQQDAALDPCIRSRMMSEGFDFDNPTIISTWAIIGKH